MTRTVHGTYMSGGRPSELVAVVHYDDTDEWYVESFHDQRTWRRPVYKVTSECARKLLKVAAQRER